MPVQNTGIATPINTASIAPVSRNECGRRAAATPMASPKTTASSRAAALSSIVTGRAWPISQIADWRVRSDTPKSPRTAPSRNRTYCTYTGWSRPS